MKWVLPIQENRQHLNSGPEPFNRRGELMRIKKGPSSVKRIAHGVMGTPKNMETVKWFRDNLGLVCSDDLYAGPKENVIASFNRCDNGDEYVDHHAFFCKDHEKAGLHPFSLRERVIYDVLTG